MPSLEPHKDPLEIVNLTGFQETTTQKVNNILTKMQCNDSILFALILLFLMIQDCTQSTNKLDQWLKDINNPKHDCAPFEQKREEGKEIFQLVDCGAKDAIYEYSIKVNFKY